MMFQIAGDIINEVGVEVGIGQVTSPYSSPDPSFVQMKSLLKGSGEELNLLYDWQQQRREGTIVTVGTNPYQLPTSFDRMIDQTHWNRATSFPVTGPLDAQDWQYLKGAALAGSLLYVSFRVMQQAIYVYPETDTGHTVYYEYISNAWVENSISPGNYITAPAVDDDIVRFHPVLIKRYLKVKWLEAKGFNSQRARADLDLFFNSITGKNKGARVLSLTRKKMFPFLSSNNLPDTGYGT